MIQLYHDTSYSLCKKLTNAYSTSFSFGIKIFAVEYRNPIYAIYAFVRLADEIVDSFHGYNKAELLKKLREDTYAAINEGISANPVLHSFQQVVNKYNIDHDLIDAFLKSMEMDLTASSYKKNNYEVYIYGSAESVGLMCLQVFVDGNKNKFNQLSFAAKKLGSAFQKVNFLRDIKSDIDERGRIYLPDTHETGAISNERKRQLEKEVEEEFVDALKGILQLPIGVRLGVYSAYMYYFHLFNKIRVLDIRDLFKQRVRIANPVKLFLLVKAYWKIKILKISF